MNGRTFTVELTSAARRDLKKLSKDGQRRVGRLIDELSHDPRPHNCKPLQGPLKGYFRVRDGNFRVVYHVDDDRVLVLIVTVGDRRDIYS